MLDEPMRNLGDKCPQDETSQKRQYLAPEEHQDGPLE